MTNCRVTRLPLRHIRSKACLRLGASSASSEGMASEGASERNVSDIANSCRKGFQMTKATKPKTAKPANHQPSRLLNLHQW